MSAISNRTCSICWDDLVYPEKSANEVELGCGHVYHKPCIDRWMDHLLDKYLPLTCPYDRSLIFEYGEEKIDPYFVVEDVFEDGETIELDYSFMGDNIGDRWNEPD